MAAPEIAILIPCYNASRYLERIFSDIQNQTVPFDEVLFYNDSSTDETAAIAASMGIRMINANENKGAAFGRNRLLDLCNSEWVHFHDADDGIDPLFVEKIKKTISDHHVSGTTCILSDMIVKDESGKKVGEVNYRQADIAPDATAYFLKNTGYAIVGCYPAKLLRKINGFNEKLRGNEDPDLHLRLALAGASFITINQTLVTNYIHPGSFSQNNWTACMIDKLGCLEEYQQHLGQAYQHEIGRQSASLSNYFYRERLPELSKRARNLTYKTGVKNIGTGKIASLIIRFLGLPAYLWIYRKRTDLGLP